MATTVLALSVSAWGCYRPDIGNGTLTCFEQRECPDGFHCGLDNLCWTSDGGAPEGEGGNRVLADGVARHR